MNTIAERLRKRALDWVDADEDKLLDLEAADELDRLQKVLDSIEFLASHQKVAQPYLRKSLHLWDEVLDSLYEYRNLP